MTAALVDFHCHLDLYPDFPKVAAECKKSRVYTLGVTTTPKAWEGNNLVTGNLKYVQSALGLHPQLLAQHHHEIDLWEALLSQTRYVGEVGLDGGPKYLSTMDLQQRIFSRILIECERAGGKILTVHSVRAVSRVLDMVQELTTRDRTKIVLHWFTGSKAELRRAIELGMYFSINPRMLDNDRSASIVGNLPLDHILTETDGPFVSDNGIPLRPHAVKRCLDGLSNIFQRSPEEMAQQVLGNLKAILIED